MKILSASQVRYWDQYTIESEAISPVDLMERAARSFYGRLIKEVLPTKRIYVFAGKGNNGGDALVVARMLVEAGFRVDCFLLNPDNKLLAPDCLVNKERLIAQGKASFVEVHAAMPVLSIGIGDVIIDGIFGTGLNKPATGLFAEAIALINRSGAEVYSIDLPSGLLADDNSENEGFPIVQASKTFTFACPKLSLLLPDSGLYAGEWEVIDIGLNPEALETIDTTYHYTQPDDALAWIKKRKPFAYKNQFGHVLVVAGSKGKIGAAVLCAEACLRSGAGLLTCHLPACGEVVMQTALPEAMTIADKEADYISQVNPSAYTTLAVGPGLGTAKETAQSLKDILLNFRRPLVLDADALNIISVDKEMECLIPPGSILTPHPGELNRLTGDSSPSFRQLQQARDLAKRLSCILVLKGRYTAVCSPGGQVYFNPTGNPGMATAGSGDVLTGVIAAYLAQGYDSLVAARLGVYLHGLAGDKAARAKSETALIAGDIVEHL